MKKLLSIFVFVLVLTFAFSAFADYQTVDVYVNGELLVSDSPAVLVGSRTMVPLRAISEKLGCDVGWDDATQTAEIKNEKTAVYVTIDSDVMVKKSLAEDKSEDIKIDAPAMLYKSRTLIPLRAVSEALDAKVDWDSEKECALITTGSHQAYYGIVTEKGYVSEELGIEFVAPVGTEINHYETAMDVTEWTDDVSVADADTVAEFNARFKDTGSNLTFAVSPKTSVTSTEYLEFLKASLASDSAGISYSIAPEFHKFEVAGYQFERIEVVAQSGETVLNMRYCAGKINDRLVIMIIFYADGQEVNASEFVSAIVRTR